MVVAAHAMLKYIDACAFAVMLQVYARYSPWLLASW